MDTVILHSHTDLDYAERAAQVLRRGGLVAIPTETVYGLAASALDEEAIQKIYAAKGRPSDNPLIVHIASFDDWAPLVREIPAPAMKLAKAFWPGPLTIVLPKSDRVPKSTSGGLETVAVRMPSHPAAQAIIAAAKLPLAAPSANISGFPSPTKAEHVIDDMNGRIDMIIDGGDAAVGVESTVISFTGETPQILRPGGVTPEQIRSVIGEVTVSPAALHPLGKNETAESPGMKYRHYAPKAEITVFAGADRAYFRRLAEEKENGVFALCFTEDAERCPVPFVTMGSRSDPLSQAARLFDALRELDERGASQVLARLPDDTGVGLAVCNRLFRAAAFRFHYEAPILGLTGASGAGKSTAACYFIREDFGFTMVCCDHIARNIVEEPEILAQLVEAFGPEILEFGRLDRRQLAQLAFASEEATRKLNAITHPAILKKVKEITLFLARKGEPTVLDAPLLFSTGLDTLCDLTIAITTDKENLIARIMKRDRISREEAENRLARQEKEQFTSRADIVVRNDNRFSFQAQLRKIIRRVRALDEKNKKHLP